MTNTNPSKLPKSAKLFNKRVIPDWRRLTFLIDDTTKFLSDNNVPRKDLYIITMVMAELVENAIKHGSYNTRDEFIHIALEITKNAVLIEVRSPLQTNATEHLQRIEEAIESIRAYQHPFE